MRSSASYSGNKTGFAVSLRMSAGNSGGRNFGNQWGFYDENRQRRNVLFGIAVLVATRVFQPTKVLHK